MSSKTCIHRWFDPRAKRIVGCVHLAVTSGQHGWLCKIHSTMQEVEILHRRHVKCSHPETCTVAKTGKLEGQYEGAFV